MAGGLINIVSYVSSDLYLTGAPQITFYKMVYRRYTNFAMESIYVNFDDDIKFDSESELVVPRIGDLVHKSFFHISIPNISITKQDVGIDADTLQYVYLDKSTVSDFEKIRSVYMKIFTDIYRIIYSADNASNVTYTGLVKDVYDYVMTGDNRSIIDDYDKLLLQTRQTLQNQNDPRESLLDSTRSNLWYILTHIDAAKLLDYAERIIDTTKYDINSDEYLKEIQRIMKDTTFKEIDNGFIVCKRVQGYYFDENIKFLRQSNNDKSNNIRCAWVKNLGHSIIEYVDVYIGGKKIDHHLGIWINIWYQLTYRQDQIETYNKMIGNVSELTNFDNQEKPAYDLYIPMTFWFNKFNGLSFPLIAMQYNDLRFSIKLRKIEEVFFIEKIYKALLNGSDVILTADMIDFILNRSENKAELTLTNIEEIQDITIYDIWTGKGKQLNGHMMLDYIYLESPERKRFAQSGHEYLIERIQHNVFDNIDTNKVDVRLDFTNPSKELVWAFNKDAFIVNKYGYTPCKWYDHSLRNGKHNPIIDVKLTFNNYIRIDTRLGTYFDKYQPLTYHKVTPSDGINVYSFCLDPLQQQPTGSANFTRLTDVRFFFTMNTDYYRYNNAELYPYDLDINFKLTITDPEALIDSIDIVYIRKIIREYQLITQDATLSNRTAENIVSSDLIQLYADANSTLFIYEQLTAGNTIEIDMNAYRRLILKTTATLNVFDLSMNILRLIGGYGALAFSGND